MVLPQASTLRPGLLVALKTSVYGNVSSRTNDIERTENIVHTETVREYADRKEHELAIQTRSRVRSLIRASCAKSAFGFLCPEERRDQLDEAIAKARDLVNAFNNKAQLSRVEFNVMVGKVAANDLEAVRAINSEVRDLLNEMNRGVGQGDADAVRDAAERAKQVASMLANEAQALVEEAVDAARKTATMLVRNKKLGETPDPVAIEATYATINAKKQSFLDFSDDEAQAVVAPTTSHKLDLEGAPNGL